MSPRPRLQIAAATLDEAQTFVARHHRHHPAPPGHKFSLWVLDPAGVRRGVAIVGRPVARGLDDGHTLEATRVCTDGTPNACSALLGAAWRATRELGYHRLVTYIQGTESGASLRAAGWRLVASLRPRAGWSSTDRPRADRHPTRVRRQRWEVTTSAYQPAEFRHATTPTCDETLRPQCTVCTGPIQQARTGRPARYCTPACRQLAYRARRQHRKEAA